ncbi:MAG: Ig-like domain-containing protein [Pseudomonadota bacterium]
MRKLYTLLTLFLAAILTACGGSESLNLDDTNQPMPDDNTPPPITLSSLELLTSSPTLPSDGATDATISALVRDDSNNFVEGVTVIFSADSGGLAIVSGTTDATGVAQATLSTAGDQQNRSITVTAQADTLTSTVNVDVVGTGINVSGPGNLVAGATADYTVVLTDAGGNGIPSAQVDLSTSAGSTLNPAGPLTTDAQGQAIVTLTAAATETLTVSALGVTASQTVLVSTDVLRFDSPAASTEVDLGAVQTLTVTSLPGGVALPGENITFSTTRGTLSATTVQTNASGVATVDISSNNAGSASVSASTSAGLTTQLALEFVATVAASVEMQATPFTVAPNEQASITAIVRDAANNLVKNKLVTFSLQDVTNGTLSTGSAVTDSLGRAQTFYTASNSTSASGGVVITGTVDEGGALISDSVALTVARRELFISIGTGNEIAEPNTAQYLKEFAVQVTDADGNGVEGVNVQMSILSQQYHKGVWVRPPTGDWINLAFVTCEDEDLNRNGVLDPGEDINLNGMIEAGNIATVSPNNITTDANGFSLVNVTYPQEFAFWVTVRLEARTSVQGTEFAEGSTFLLPILADDIDNAQTPPGVTSPFKDGLMEPLTFDAVTGFPNGTITNCSIDD